jgi:hypothetical protein
MLKYLLKAAVAAFFLRKKEIVVLITYFMILLNDKLIDMKAGNLYGKIGYSSYAGRGA